ncbi:hypothetical protein WJX72_009773 [[Myrmecia] bisecta]|uniref:BZIP domain-containing protein n=1 Tax=[Myrmecia] bisecta TaxID=41462 RepID=A0AAW1QSC6_9CHLO
MDHQDIIASSGQIFPLPVLPDPSCKRLRQASIGGRFSGVSRTELTVERYGTINRTSQDVKFGCKADNRCAASYQLWLLAGMPPQPVQLGLDTCLSGLLDLASASSLPPLTSGQSSQPDGAELLQSALNLLEGKGGQCSTLTNESSQARPSSGGSDVMNCSVGHGQAARRQRQALVENPDTPPAKHGRRPGNLFCATPYTSPFAEAAHDAVNMSGCMPANCISGNIVNGSSESVRSMLHNPTAATQLAAQPHSADSHVNPACPVGDGPTAAVLHCKRTRHAKAAVMDDYAFLFDDLDQLELESDFGSDQDQDDDSDDQDFAREAGFTEACKRASVGRQMSTRPAAGAMRRSPRGSATGSSSNKVKEKRKVGRPITYKGDPNAPHLTEAEKRRIKRRIANRESARRVRQKRQGQLEELQAKMLYIQAHNQQLQERIIEIERQRAGVHQQFLETRHRWSLAAGENLLLQREMCGLRKHLQANVCLLEGAFGRGASRASANLAIARQRQASPGSPEKLAMPAEGASPTSPSSRGDAPAGQDIAASAGVTVPIVTESKGGTQLPASTGAQGMTLNMCPELFLDNWSNLDNYLTY